MTDQSGRKYKSKIELGESYLYIAVDYEYPTTREEVELMLDYYQRRFSQKAQRQVPREEIKVKPAEGELRGVTTRFVVMEGEPLYLGLREVHQRAPYVLPRLIEDLQTYTGKHNLQTGEIGLVEHAINGLREVIGSSGD